MLCTAGPQHGGDGVVEMGECCKQQQYGVAYDFRKTTKFLNRVGDPMEANKVKNKLCDPTADDEFFIGVAILKPKYP